MRSKTDKLRYDLIPTFAHKQLAKVLTVGCDIYEDERAWEKGNLWSDIIASLERHLYAYKDGEDFDSETGLLHIAHVLTNAMFLTEYYKIYPQGDNRNHLFLKPPKIGLDIDDVLADWIGAWTEKYEMVDPVLFWNFDHEKDKRFAKECKNKSFWLGIKPKIKAEELPFQPHCYITSRSIPIEWTEDWLKMHNYPDVPLYVVPFNTSKITSAIKSKLDWFVDDKYENFVELNNAGICTFLFDAPHNRKYDVGFKRIKTLNDLVTKNY